MRRMQGARILHKNLGENMKMIGSLNHENLVSLRGYYSCFSDTHTQVFGIYDYFSRGSLATMLYVPGKRDHHDGELEWDARIRIAVGAARGLAHIHRQCGGNLVHGNLKASNIFINLEGYGCLADFCVVNLLFPSKSRVITVRGYRPPEELRLAHQGSDIYSFGVILFELLGGKSPEHVIYSRYGDWARHKARDDWTTLVFDRGLLKDAMIKGEMQGMLHVALSCVAKDSPRKRISMDEVVNMLESIVP